MKKLIVLIAAMLLSATLASAALAQTTPPPPPQTPYNLVGEWSMQFEKGSIVEGSGGGVVDDFAYSQFTIDVSSGQVNSDGSHSYNGVVTGWKNSSVSIWYVPDVAAGKQKYMEMYIYISEPQFGTEMAASFNIACSMFVGTSETSAWGLQKTLWYDAGAYSGVAQTPDTLYTSRCNGWKQNGIKGDKK